MRDFPKAALRQKKSKYSNILAFLQLSAGLPESFADLMLNLIYPQVTTVTTRYFLQLLLL
jgi:hypothetical protein